MEQLTVFNFNQQEVRTVLVETEPFFCLKDVCDILEVGNVSQLKTRLIQDGVITNEVIDNLGRTQQATFINESNLYKTIFQSRKPQAEAFTEWVTGEVLPSIRKTGSYKVPTTPMEAIKLMIEAQEQTQADVKKVEQRVTNIEENAPLTPSEYAMLQSKISERVRTIKRERGLNNLNRAQQGELYRSINHEIKVITGVQVRSQIRQKDLKKVLDFIYDWEPSKSTLVLINDLNSNQ